MITGKDRQQERGEKKGTILTGHALVAGFIGAVLGGMLGSLAGPTGIVAGVILGTAIGGAIGAMFKGPAPSVPNVGVSSDEGEREAETASGRIR